jgi:hypothetical protein
MSYGFDNNSAPALDAVKLPTPKPREAAPVAAPAPQVLQAAAELGFVSREVSARRKPGPKRKEPQDKITVTGPKRVMDRLKAYCDRIGGVSYCDGIEALLDDLEKTKA